MSKIAIVTDSTSDLPEELVKKYNLEIVPLSVLFGEKSFLDDGKQITGKDFYEKMKSAENLPTTVQPTPKDFIEKYTELLKKYDSIISVHLSKKMSGTINSAELAVKEMAGKDIEIIDTEYVHMGLGFMAIRAAELAQAGKSKQEIIESINDLRSKMNILFIPKTLENLKKGGRLGGAKGLIASLLEIKPCLTVKNGEVSQFKTTRRWNQAKTELIESMKTMVKNPKNLVVSVGNANANEEGDEMFGRIKEAFSPKNIFQVDIGAVVGTHLGSGGIGITFYEE